MVTKQLSIAIAISICIVSGLVWSDLKTFAAAPASETKIDFDQVFADATRQGEFSPSIHDGLRRVGRNFNIHNMKDQCGFNDVRGKNPFANWQIEKDGQQVLLSSIYPTYDWVNDRGRENIGTWIEAAATKAGK